MKKEENAAEKEEEIKLLSDEIIEHIKEYKEAKAEYINIQEEKLYDKYEMTEANGRTEEDVTIVYAYVTFRSMKGKDRCINTFSHVEDLAKKDPKEDEKKFMDMYLEIEEALPPGAMQW